jgi:hypothetical protein
MSKVRATSIVNSCIESIRAAIDSVPLPSGSEQAKANLEAMWTRRAWATGAVKVRDR